jgi:L-rhamnose mutarotase
MITKLNKHDTHTVSIHLTKPGSKHYAALRCVDCNKHIQWLSQQDAEQLKGEQ